MGPSEKAFNQVKSILGKLDRNIDQLREQRKSPAPVATQPPPGRVEPPKPARAGRAGVPTEQQRLRPRDADPALDKLSGTGL